VLPLHVDRETIPCVLWPGTSEPLYPTFSSALSWLTELVSFLVLEFLENITPTEPMEDNIKWDDDEPAVGGVMASFGPAYDQSAFHPPPPDPDVEDLQGSVVSYPGEEKNAHGGKRTPGARRSVSAHLLWRPAKA